MSRADWPSARRRVAALALIVAALTAATALTLHGTGWIALIGVAWVGGTGLGLYRPAAAVALPVAGQVLAVALLLVPAPPHLLWLLPVVAGVLLSAELVGVAARLAYPFARDPASALRGAARSAFVGAGVFAVVALLVTSLDALPSPSGLAATVLAVGACALLAVVFARAGKALRDRG